MSSLLKQGKKEAKDKVRRTKIKIRKDILPFICTGCREHLSHEAMIGNVAGFCPHCGGAVRSKAKDDIETQNKVARPALGGM